jgi:protein tyrosine phosphatase (PTP) superfamily phosphohydrolase (DUF442 family)
MGSLDFRIALSRRLHPELRSIFEAGSKGMRLISWLRTVCFSMRPMALWLVSLGLVFSLAAGSSAKSGGDERDRGGIEDSEVKNFGKISDHIYRGGQPKSDEYRWLAGMGIKTVIDLREDPQTYARPMARDAGLNYINIRLSSRRQPTPEEANFFLHLVNDQENWPVYVHCAAGKHRTGALVAVYRMKMEGWDAEKAYREMKDYGFYSRFGHGMMKTFVFDYYQNLLAQQQSLPPASEPESSSGSRARRVSEGHN